MYFTGKGKALGRFGIGTPVLSGKYPVIVTGIVKSDKDGKIYCYVTAKTGEYAGRTWKVPESSLKPRF